MKRRRRFLLGTTEVSAPCRRTLFQAEHLAAISGRQDMKGCIWMQIDGHAWDLYEPAT
jgi:hypothetical protein